jgi:hypothetical protein
VTVVDSTGSEDNEPLMCGCASVPRAFSCVRGRKGVKAEILSSNGRMLPAVSSCHTANLPSAFPLFMQANLLDRPFPTHTHTHTHTRARARML